jgi:hypothetical protein
VSMIHATVKDWIQCLKEEAYISHVNSNYRIIK